VCPGFGATAAHCGASLGLLLLHTMTPPVVQPACWDVSTGLILFSGSLHEIDAWCRLMFLYSVFRVQEPVCKAPYVLLALSTTPTAGTVCQPKMQPVKMAL
jgi:hypothetical protein